TLPLPRSPSAARLPYTTLFRSHVYEAPKGCDLLDVEAWKAANPALGLFRSEDDLREQMQQAARMPSMRNTARNLLLNQRVSLDRSEEHTSELQSREKLVCRLQR